MKHFTTATVFFPLGRLSEEFFNTYMVTYEVDVSNGVTLDGLVVSQTPVESDTYLAAIFWDNKELLRFRKASMPSGTLEPTPVYDPPLDEDGDTEGHDLTGHTLRCGFPELFLQHVENPPPGMETTFAGVVIYP